MAEATPARDVAERIAGEIRARRQQLVDEVGPEPREQFHRGRLYAYDAAANIADTIAAAGQAAAPAGQQQWARIPEDDTVKAALVILRDGERRIGLPGWPLYTRHVSPWVPAEEENGNG